MRKKWIMIAVIIGVVATDQIMSDVEIPKYKIVESKGNIEIRQYDSMIIAEVQMDGKREAAIRGGFRYLADYIFGNNAVRQDIAMTAPVQQQKNTKIAMTAPVQQRSTGGSWQVSFVMPSKYSMETLPEPVNDRVILKEIPAKQFVVITFSGTNLDTNVKKHEEKLMKYVKENNLSIIGPPKYAFYSPPRILPPMRRNEVMIEIQ